MRKIFNFLAGLSLLALTNCTTSLTLESRLKSVPTSQTLPHTILDLEKDVGTTKEDYWVVDGLIDTAAEKVESRFPQIKQNKNLDEESLTLLFHEIDTVIRRDYSFASTNQDLLNVGVNYHLLK